MKRKLIFRSNALADLNEVESYTVRAWGRAQAKRYVAALVADIKALRVSAMRYPTHDGVFAGLRRKRSGMHHIYYFASNDHVEILDVIHVQRDPAQHLKIGNWRDDG